MSKTTFSGPIISESGGFRTEKSGFTIIGIDFNASSSGGRFVSEGGYVETITNSSGATREVSGVPFEVPALSGPEAGIIGTARAYSTNLSRTSIEATAISKATLYIDVGGLHWRVYYTTDRAVIGRESAGEVYPAYIFQILQGSQHQLGAWLGATMTCLVAPTSVAGDVPPPIGLSGAMFSAYTQGNIIPTQIVTVAPRAWSAGDIVNLDPSSFLNNWFMYLTQGALPLYNPGSYSGGLFKIEITARQA